MLSGRLFQIRGAASNSWDVNSHIAVPAKRTDNWPSTWFVEFRVVIVSPMWTRLKSFVYLYLTLNTWPRAAKNHHRYTRCEYLGFVGSAYSQDETYCTCMQPEAEFFFFFFFCSPVNPMVTMRLKYDVSILVCHVRCPSLPSCSVVNNSGPLVYYWSTSCMDDHCCVFPVYSNVVLWLAVCPRTFLIRGQTTWDVSFLSLWLLSGGCYCYG